MYLLFKLKVELRIICELPKYYIKINIKLCFEIDKMNNNMIYRSVNFYRIIQILWFIFFGINLVYTLYFLATHNDMYYNEYQPLVQFLISMFTFKMIYCLLFTVDFGAMINEIIDANNSRNDYRYVPQYDACNGNKIVGIFLVAIDFILSICIFTFGYGTGTRCFSLDEGNQSVVNGTIVENWTTGIVINGVSACPLFRFPDIVNHKDIYYYIQFEILPFYLVISGIIIQILWYPVKSLIDSFGHCFNCQCPKIKCNCLKKNNNANVARACAIPSNYAVPVPLNDYYDDLGKQDPI
jgi:hypothetical protein